MVLAQADDVEDPHQPAHPGGRVVVGDRAARLRFGVGPDQLVSTPKGALAVAEDDPEHLPGPLRVEHHPQLGLGRHSDSPLS